eukprot:TRINITY_DN8834_c0_g1::TRINITY_DN8834_c0_g1_i1::g.19071::m.19071 TRINITY_DN8834_c0_g1::TRINITY_DN8834_c0_g1_i1::g.19071  ORF type:complete len:169 (-),score=-8.45,CcoS/PF03597.10/1.6e+03,CcoS/PF03597.10/5.6e+02,CcoS/PF03597.10/1.3,CcoS/PF03597.10/4.3e+02 TRINITY_DN8834_c0_g1_i1:497-1003(-)
MWRPVPHFSHSSLDILRVLYPILANICFLLLAIGLFHACPCPLPMCSCHYLILSISLVFHGFLHFYMHSAKQTSVQATGSTPVPNRWSSQVFVAGMTIQLLLYVEIFHLPEYLIVSAIIVGCVTLVALYYQVKDKLVLSPLACVFFAIACCLFSVSYLCDLHRPSYCL